MATLEDLDDLEQHGDKDQKDEGDKDKKIDGDAKMEDADGKKEEEEDAGIDPEILNASTTDIINRKRLLDNELRILRSEYQRLSHEKTTKQESIKDNLDKIENNR
jgi:26S proteasome regulatory subunit T5